MNDLLKLQCENCYGPLELKRDNYGALLAGCKYCAIDYLVEKPQVNQTHHPVHIGHLQYVSSTCYSFVGYGNLPPIQASDYDYVRLVAQNIAKGS